MRWLITLVIAVVSAGCAGAPAQAPNRSPGTFPVEYRDLGGARCFYWPGTTTSLSCVPLKALE